MNTEQDWIPKNWTFESKAVAERFDRHVREQLPWYDVLTASIVHIAAHYIPNEGFCYDIGASTGNVGRALAPFLRDREADLVSIEKSHDMALLWRGPGSLIEADALAYDFSNYDFAVLMLVLMFLPVAQRQTFLRELALKINPGGALVIVDKVVSPSGYEGTVFRRMAIKWKLDAGVSAEEVFAKELSLGGVQRPIDPEIFACCAPMRVTEFFRFGEFAGWIVTNPERFSP